MNLDRDVQQLFKKQIPRRKEGSSRAKAVALKMLAGFLVVMTGLTFLSRVADNMVIPKVYAALPKEGRIDHRVEQSGVLHAKEEDGLSLESGFRVKQVYVEKGDYVKKGDPLLELDAKELKDKLKAAQNELKKLQLQYKQLQLEGDNLNQSENAREAQKKLERLQTDRLKALEDEERKIKRTEDKVQRAQADYEEAQKDFEAFKEGNLEAQIEKAEAEVVEAQKNLGNQKYEQDKAVKKAELALKEAKENLWLVAGQGVDATAALQAVERATMDYEMIKSDWQRIVKEAEEKVKQAKAKLDKLQSGEVDTESLKAEEAKVKAAKEQVEGAQRAVEDVKLDQVEVIEKYDRDIEDAKLNIEEAKQKDEEALKDQDQVAQKHTIQLQLMEVDLVAKQKEIQKMQDLVAEEGTMKAPTDGMITEVKVEEGQTTTGGKLVHFVPDVSEYIFEAELSSDEAEGLGVGDDVTITLDGKKEPVEATIESISYSSEGEGDKKKVKVILSEGAPGMKGTMKIDKSSDKFSVVLPIEALREDNGSKYVLVARVMDTTLGEQVVTERIDVMEMDKNTTSVAVQGAFNANDKVITKSNKPLQAGDRVRLMEP